MSKELLARSLKVSTGTIVDATIIGTPSSTKNAGKARDPETHHPPQAPNDIQETWGDFILPSALGHVILSRLDLS